MNLKYCIASFPLFHISLMATAAQQNLQVGDEICTSGYVMDYFSIKNGNLLDNPSVRTLEGPDQHSVHCLVDVSVCRDSEFEILLPPDELTNETLYSRGWRVDDEGRLKLVDLARSVGSTPSCSTCTGEGSLRQGFHAGIIGIVLNLNASQDSPIVISVDHAEATRPDDDFCASYGIQTNDPPHTPAPASDVTNVFNLKWFVGMLLLLGSLV